MIGLSEISGPKYVTELSMMGSQTFADGNPGAAKRAEHGTWLISALYVQQLLAGGEELSCLVWRLEVGQVW